MMAKVVPALAALQLAVAADLPGAWTAGQATRYGGSNLGLCGMGTETTTSDPFPSAYYGAPDHTIYASGGACGACYEVRCTGPAGATECNCGTRTVVFQVNNRGDARVGDVPHFKLNRLTFGNIVTNNIDTCVTANIEYRRTDCKYNPAGIKAAVAVLAGSSSTLFQFVPKNIAGYGSIATAEVRSTGETGWTTCTRGVDSGVFTCVPCDTCLTGLQAPVSMRFTDEGGNVLTGLDLIASVNTEATYTFASNFEVSTPAPGTTPAPTPAPGTTPAPTPAPGTTPVPRPAPVTASPGDGASSLAVSLAALVVAVFAAVAF